MDLSKAKTELRNQILQARPGDSTGLTSQIFGLIQSLQPKIVASYVPLASEPDVGSFNRAESRDFELVFPRITGETLEFATGDCVPGNFGLLEPIGSAVNPEQIDLFLIPALAVDEQGNRLGKGKGFYDRFLSQPLAGKAIAVVFDSEVLESIPADHFDIGIDGVVTPSKWWLLPPR